MKIDPDNIVPLGVLVGILAFNLLMTLLDNLHVWSL